MVLTLIHNEFVERNQHCVACRWVLWLNKLQRGWFGKFQGVVNIVMKKEERAFWTPKEDNGGWIISWSWNGICAVVRRICFLIVGFHIGSSFVWIVCEGSKCLERCMVYFKGGMLGRCIIQGAGRSGDVCRVRGCKW